MFLGSFATNFWPSLWSNLIATAAVALGVYLLIERRLHLREREERREEFLQQQETRREEFERQQQSRREEELERERSRRWEVTHDVLRSIKDELDHNAEQAALLIQHLPKGELPFPAFEVNGWQLIVQTPVFTSLQERTLRRLLRVYNRCRTANEYYLRVNDLMFGSSAVLAVSAITNITDTAIRHEEEQKFLSHRQVLMNRLLDRVEELQPHIAEARDLVGEELDAAPPGVA